MNHRRLPTSVSELLWASFLTTYGPVLTFLGVAVGIGAWFISAQAQVSIGWLVWLALMYLVSVTSLMHALILSFRAAGRSLPAVRFAVAPPQVYSDLSAILLLEPSDLFAQDALISIYQIRDLQYEVLVAIGKVLTIQENGLIQIGIVSKVEGDGHLLQRLLANDVTVLQTLIVKPTVPTHMLQQVGVQP